MSAKTRCGLDVHYFSGPNNHMSTQHAGALTACKNAATALFGAGSAEYDAVVAAYAAINVN